VAILTRDGASPAGPLDERPLREDEEVLAALWRKVEAPWSG
jgi:hypothetical protein